MGLPWVLQYLLVILVVGMVPSVLVHMVSGSLNWVYAVGSLAYFAWMLGFVLPQKLDNPHMDTLVNICFLCAFGTGIGASTYSVLAELTQLVV